MPRETTDPGDTPDGASAPPVPGCPRATYRLQFNAAFGFDHATRIVPYLAKLGISHIYASPIFKARPGSTHGYDVIDPNRLNPELGDDSAFEHLVSALHDHGLGLILDVVPNHMGIGADNPWWLDVLEWGQASPYASFFDIDWEATARGVRDKVLLPVLGDQYGRILAAGDLQLVFAADTGGFEIRYWENRFPIAVRQYPRFLAEAAGRLENGADLFDLAARFARLAEGGRSAARQRSRRQEGMALKTELRELAATDAVRAALEATVGALNGRPGRLDSWRPLHRLIEDQAYRLAYWRVATSEINYRRFFDINDLAGLRMERAEVFEATHRLLLRLIESGKVQGVRLDHIDGLYDPAGYFRRLLTRVGEVLGRPVDARNGSPIHLLVEKILARHENLRDHFDVAGTTGYEFMNLVLGVFLDPDGELPLTATYYGFIGERPRFSDIVVEAKRNTLKSSLDSELHVLAHELHRLAQQSLETRDFSLTGMREALTDIIVAFPVYRTYLTADGPRSEDRRDLDWAVSHARKATTIFDQSIFDFLEAALSTDLKDDRSYRRRDVLATAMHFQQLTGPVMAKSLEDTAFYRFHRLVALNEVGGEPDHFGVSPAAFHTLAHRQQRYTPLGMLATATHDHKRGEDVRARLAVLSEVPRLWRYRVRRWAQLNQFRRQEIGGRRIPSANDEYLLYQTLVGVWPFEIGSPDDIVGSDLADRVVAYMLKAVREAKVETSWIARDPTYEEGLEAFVRGSLELERSRAFLADLIEFVALVATPGALNGLAQTLLKLTAPGVPDTYQGTELWDLSLVDPDNRRPVDFVARDRLLGAETTPDALLDDWQTGAIKQFVVARTLAFRSEVPDLFTHGAYLPLQIEGGHLGKALAFARSQGGRAVLIVVPRLTAPWLEGRDRPHVAAEHWGDTQVVINDDVAGLAWSDRFTGARFAAATTLPLADLFRTFPLALLASSDD